jgi:hypothetical protein
VSPDVLVGSLDDVKHRSRLANLPVRVATGAFILNSGLNKLKAEKETAQQLHGFASGTYPVLESIPPDQFAKLLGAAEVGLGGALLMPLIVGDGPAGFGLTAFAGGLLGLYAKTPGLRQEGSIRPTKDGTAIAKDSWLAGIGLALMASSVSSRRLSRLERKVKGKGKGKAKAKAKVKEAKHSD